MQEITAKLWAWVAPRADLLLISSLAVIAPVKGIMVAVGALIFFDLVTGVMAARKRGERITSAALRRTISKLVVYQMSVLSGFILETYLISDIVPIAKLVAGVIGMVECLSVAENMKTVTGVDITQIFKKLGSQNDRSPPKREEDPPEKKAQKDDQQ